MKLNIEIGYEEYNAYGETRKDKRVVGISIESSDGYFKGGSMNWSSLDRGPTRTVGPRFKSLFIHSETGAPLTLEIMHTNDLDISVEVNPEDIADKNSISYECWDFESISELEQWLTNNAELNSQRYDIN